ncbi:hypothetical protein CLOM_g18543 [Closterium sp. NIES-68]|nr:hypothetical protein CLOM_g18543 [Closterium sp. NIES-68]GJP64322.1 hypothetical protein CLOP_g21331 [Closterium sp. NIES-67]
MTPWLPHRRTRRPAGRRESRSGGARHERRSGSLSRPRHLCSPHSLLLALLLLLDPIAPIQHGRSTHGHAGRSEGRERVARGHGVVGVRALIKERPRKHPEMEDAFRERVQDLLASFERNADMAALTLQQTGCSCYHIRNNYCCSQNLCLCSPMCWNGHQMISLGQPQCVAAKEQAPPPPNEPKPILRAVGCHKEVEFSESLRVVTDEAVNSLVHLRDAGMGGNGGGVGEGRGWLETRRRVEWRLGLTFLQRFDYQAVNVAHFIGKAFTLLLANNFTDPAVLQPMVARFMLPRDDFTLERWRMGGGYGIHALVLQALIEFALTPFLTPQMHTSTQMATEEEPLCFERVLLPGILKGQVYPSSPAQAGYLQRHLRIKLRLQPPAAVVWGAEGAARWRPQVLYITRLGAELRGRRAFLPESHEALLRLMEELNMEVTMAELSQLTFKQQFDAIQAADIIISLHGAALANPPLFARRSTALIEIMPYHVLHETYYAMALSAGLPYFLKMCRRGSFQAGDRAEVDSLSLYDCTHGHPECKEYFTHRRRVELTAEDLSELRVILSTAREVVGAALGGMGETVGPDELPGWAERRFGDQCVARDAGLFCRNDFVRIVGGAADFTCVFSRDCEGQEQPQ